MQLRVWGEIPSVTINAVNCTTFNFTLSYTGSVIVEWGDGTMQTTGTDFNKTYSSPFTGVIKIKGSLGSVTSFTSFSNTGIAINFKEFWKFRALVNLILQGNCVISNSVFEIPRVTTNLTLQSLPNLTLTGTSLDLPRVTSTLTLRGLPNLTLTGTIIDLPRVTSTLALQNLTNLTLTGTSLDLPRVTSVLEFRSLPNITITGNLIDLPRVTVNLILIVLPNLTITGTSLDLPRVTSNLEFSNLPNLTLTGNLIDLPRVINRCDLQILPNVTLTGTPLNLPRVTGSLDLNTTPNITLTGDFANLPLSSTTQIAGIISSSVAYTPSSAKRATISAARIEMSTKFTTTQTDDILIDYATFSTTWNIPRTIRLSSLGRTSASDAAVATLVSRGVTITLI